MLFGLSDSSVLAIAGGLGLYYYGSTLMPGTITGSNRMMYSIALAAGLYFFKVGDTLMNSLGINFSM